MKSRDTRVDKIKSLINTHRIQSQGQLLELLQTEGLNLTQATLSRDLKKLHVAKVSSSDGGYLYTLPQVSINNKHELDSSTKIEYKGSTSGFKSVDISGQFCVIKTRPGYAGGIALDIDSLNAPHIMGTIAGDDTILVILREGSTESDIIAELQKILPIEE